MLFAANQIDASVQVLCPWNCVRRAVASDELKPPQSFPRRDPAEILRTHRRYCYSRRPSNRMRHQRLDHPVLLSAVHPLDQPAYPPPGRSAAKPRCAPPSRRCVAALARCDPPPSFRHLFRTASPSRWWCSGVEPSDDGQILEITRLMMLADRTPSPGREPQRRASPRWLSAYACSDHRAMAPCPAGRLLEHHLLPDVGELDHLQSRSALAWRK